MIIGVPKEIKKDEYRVALVPVGAETLTRMGHKVLVQKSAGEGSGFSDAEYRAAGASIIPSAKAIFAKADMIIKVKEPQPVEIRMIRKGQIIFTYFHFAASRSLTMGMVKTGATCIAYETMEEIDGTLPLLTPMSEVAGRMAIQEGAKYLERPQSGRGILLAGVPGVPPAHILILGGGVVGANAAKIAAGFRADVAILDVNLDRLRYLDDIMPPNVNCLYSDRHTIRQQLRLADLVIGAVLIPGAKAPLLVRRDDLKLMKPGSVIIDVAVDQGGCVETSRPTTHSDPTFIDRLLRGFKGDTERLVREIGDALGARRYEAAKDAAHALRGGAASVGAMQLMQVATRIDKATHDMLRLKAAQWTEELVGTANRALLELDNHLETRRRRGLGGGDA